MKEKTQGFLSEFKAFAMKGNVIDLAVGVIIGGAFNNIVSSLVNDIIMPLIGSLIGGTDFKNLKIVLNSVGPEPATLAYGQFIQNVVDFIIIAFSIFIMIKVIGKLNRKKEAEKENVVEEVKEPELTREEILLTEIRDLLKK